MFRTHPFCSRHLLWQFQDGSHSDCGPIPDPSPPISKECMQSHLHLEVFLNTYKAKSGTIYYISVSFSLFIYVQTVPDFHIFSFSTANTFMHYTSTSQSAFCMPNPDFHTSADQRTFCTNVWWHRLSAKSSVWAAMPSLSGRAGFMQLFEYFLLFALIILPKLIGNEHWKCW